jgi:hypothetical protein
MADAISKARKTREEVLAENAFKPGNPGGPGRPKGSRNKLGEAFLEALCDDFKEHGVQAIIDMRQESPKDYVKVVASTLPSQLNVKVSEWDELTDEQLDRRIASLLSQLNQAGVGSSSGDAAPQVSPQSLN